MLKIKIMFDDEDERDLVLKIAEMIKAKIPGMRMHPPHPGDDGKYHMSLNSPKH